jgi:hypothetical protein
VQPSAKVGKTIAKLDMTLFPGLFNLLMILLGNVESERRHGWLSRSGEAQRL